MTSGGLREYRLYVPASYTGTNAVPLILSFHGMSGSAMGQEWSTGLSTASEETDAGFIVVYPEGIEGGWNSVQLPEPAPDDVAFIDELLDELQSSLCIDSAMVFSTGFSNGAMMSVRLACSLSDRIAAVAPVAGAYFPPLAVDSPVDEKCPDQRPVPMIAFHGTSDTLVPFDGGPGALDATYRLPIDNVTPADDVMSEWAAHNGCTSGRKETQLADQVRLVSYLSCEEDATVELYVEDGGGHRWPRWTTTNEMSANGLIWEFFQAHPMGHGVDPAHSATLSNADADTDGGTTSDGTER